MNIIYLFFNRPEKVRSSFERIRSARPSRLYLVADGPRAGRSDDVGKCEESRQIVRSRIDWKCEVVEDFADKNLGCGRRVASGISKAFEMFEEAIILEDDCLPEPSFFTYCETLLDRYRNDNRVMVVTGNNFQRGRRRGSGDYYFSKYPHCWGWATWRRAWMHFDSSIAFWPQVRDEDVLGSIFSDSNTSAYWQDVFERFYRGEIDTWDYPWTLCVWLQGGLTATPNVNLVSNIGFGGDATHTTSASELAEIPTHALSSFQPPIATIADANGDQYVAESVFGIVKASRSDLKRLPERAWSLAMRVRRKLHRLVVGNDAARVRAARDSARSG